MHTSRTGKLLAILGMLTGLATGGAWAEDAPGMTTVIPGAQWEKGDKAMPYGLKVMRVYGDPAKPGPYVVRYRMATGYKLPPHKFSDDRVSTILKGIYWSAEGERYDPIKMTELQAGSLFVTPAGTPHFGWARTEVILQVVGTGPVENPIEYVNPDDDPRVE